MSLQRLGTEGHFHEFLMNQVKAYQLMLQDHYGLPTEALTPHIEISFMPQMRALKMTEPPSPPEFLELEHILFTRELFYIGKKPKHQMFIWVMK